MWRDRTNLFISYRQSYSHHPTGRSHVGASAAFGDNGSVAEERRGLMSAGAFDHDGDAVIEMDVLPPRWLDIQDEVTEWLDSISKLMRKLEQLHQKHVLPGFDDDAVKQREEREIDAMTSEITRGFQTCQKAIKRIDRMVRDAKQNGGIASGEETMANNLKISLATRVGDVSALFRKKQTAYMKKLRQLGGMNTPLDGTSTPIPQNPYTDPSLMDSEMDRTSAQSTLLQQKQLAKQRSTGLHDTTIAQREREIEQIAQGIIDLSNIFQELQTMVIDQGTMLDRVDYNVERMATDVKEADKELKVATTYQKKTTKRKILLLLVLLVVGMFILLLVKPKHRGGQGTPMARPPVADAPAVEDPPPADAPFRVRRELWLDGAARKMKRDWRRRKRRWSFAELVGSL
ncbi:hypothetical protein AAFC00_003996 [Neodothiora populina]|uniref:t-SNARE coiled-coil homology domain-containing protein n=1 Tax=Neodothiora populina TaxID=2781224 RepID=A0ABR3PI64_9PEZI